MSVRYVLTPLDIRRISICVLNNLVATIITQQVYISRVTRLENVDKNVELLRQNVQFLLASTDESDHARFTSKQMNGHVATIHEGEKQLKCDICNTNFGQKG